MNDIGEGLDGATVSIRKYPFRGLPILSRVSDKTFGIVLYQAFDHFGNYASTHTA
jgi:hypothetical protein